MLQPAAVRQSGWRARAITACSVLLATVLIALPASATTHGAKGKPDLSGTKLRVGVVLARDTSTQEIRLASGAFDNTPYEIKWATFPTGSAALEGVNAGALDMTVELQAPSPIVAQSGAKTPWTRATAPFKIVAAALPPAAGGPAIGVHPDSGIRKVADLKGKKVAYARGTTAHIYWLIAMREAKLKQGDVQAVELPVAEARAAYLSGAVDGLVTVNRTFLPMVRDGQAEVLARSNGIVPEYRVTTARTAFLDDKTQRAVVGDFVERVARSKHWLAKHKAEAAAVYERVAKVDPTDAKAAVNEMAIDVVPVDAELAKAMQAQSKVLNDEGVTPTNPKIAIILDGRYNTGLATAR